jgi:hypothetical protein
VYLLLVPGGESNDPELKQKEKKLRGERAGGGGASLWRAKSKGLRSAKSYVSPIAPPVQF